MKVTNKTRRESYAKLDTANLNRHIVEVLENGGAMSAREVSLTLFEKKLIPFPVRQAVAPRLTEMMADGIVESVGKVYDEETKRNVAAYRLKQ